MNEHSEPPDDSEEPETISRFWAVLIVGIFIAAAVMVYLLLRG